MLDILAEANAARFRDGVENKVLEFFDRNPTEELCASDVCTKYGGRLDSASALLRSMHARGILSKRKQGRLTIYGRGCV